MLTRIVTAIVALCVFLPALFFSDSWYFPVLFALCALIGTGEMLNCLGLLKKLWISVPLCLIAAAAPVCVRLAETYWPLYTHYIAHVALSGILLLAVYLFAVAVLGHKKLDVATVGLSCLMFLYVVGGFTGVVYLHDLESRSFCYMIFVGAWVTDTFAYFTGRLLGRHKLISEVSPKKTVEGAIGGAAFCIVAFVVFAFLYNSFWITEGKSELSPILLGVVGLFVSVVSQIGDLAMSLVKRRFGIKDYGRLLPGHGGVLDRFDSVLAVSILMTVIFSLPFLH